MLWSAFETAIRRSILRDEGEAIWTSDMLLDYAGWALDAFCAHTALLKTVTYTGDGETYQHALPTDMYIEPDKQGLVYRYDPSTDEDKPVHLIPAYSSHDISPYEERAFTVWPAGTLETGVPTPMDVQLVVRYYAKWPHPTGDASELTVPGWAIPILMYDVATHALTWRVLEESDVGSGRKRPDSGQPEQNSYRATQKWYIQLYERELARHPRQSRMVSYQK